MTTLMTIGGFLGAGKTSLIAAAANLLTAQGHRVVVVTNDQAPDLVDTALVRLTGVPTAEVAGACFCCAFNDFAARTDELIAQHRPDVILAEPVGSCVDLAATVLRPMARERSALHIAPFTVCVDSAAWTAVESGEFGANTAYIYRQQILEADILMLTKCDRESPEVLDVVAEALSARNPSAAVLRSSAQDGDGLATWLADLRAATDAGGNRRIDIDYDTYAAGEAALGWLNASVTLHHAPAWKPVLPRLMAALDAACDNAGCPPAHLKCLLASGTLVMVGNRVAGRPDAEVRILVDGEGVNEARLTINARVPMAAPRLRELVTGALDGLGILATVKTIRAFPPGRPVPIHHLP